MTEAPAKTSAAPKTGTECVDQPAAQTGATHESHCKSPTEDRESAKLGNIKPKMPNEMNPEGEKGRNSGPTEIFPGNTGSSTESVHASAQEPAGIAAVPVDHMAISQGQMAQPTAQAPGLATAGENGNHASDENPKEAKSAAMTDSVASISEIAHVSKPVPVVSVDLDEFQKSLGDICNAKASSFKAYTEVWSQAMKKKWENWAANQKEKLNSSPLPLHVVDELQEREADNRIELSMAHTCPPYGDPELWFRIPSSSVYTLVGGISLVPHNGPQSDVRRQDVVMQDCKANSLLLLHALNYLRRRKNLLVNEWAAANPGRAHLWRQFYYEYLTTVTINNLEAIRPRGNLIVNVFGDDCYDRNGTLIYWIDPGKYLQKRLLVVSCAKKRPHGPNPFEYRFWDIAGDRFVVPQQGDVVISASEKTYQRLLTFARTLSKGQWAQLRGGETHSNMMNHPGASVQEYPPIRPNLPMESGAGIWTMPTQTYHRGYNPPAARGGPTAGPNRVASEAAPGPAPPAKMVNTGSGSGCAADAGPNTGHGTSLGTGPGPGPGTGPSAVPNIDLTTSPEVSTTQRGKGGKKVKRSLSDSSFSPSPETTTPPPKKSKKAKGRTPGPFSGSRYTGSR